MKKIRLFLRRLIAAICLILPALIFGWQAWPLAPAAITILAAVGVEAIWLLVASFLILIVDGIRKRRKARAISSPEDTAIEL